MSTKPVERMLLMPQLKRLITMRVNDNTERQIEEMARWWGATKTDVITVALDRMYREEAPRFEGAATPAPTPLPEPQVKEAADA